MWHRNRNQGSGTKNNKVLFDITRSYGLLLIMTDADVDGYTAALMLIFLPTTDGWARGKTLLAQPPL